MTYLTVAAVTANAEPIHPWVSVVEDSRLLDILAWVPGAAILRDKLVSF